MDNQALSQKLREIKMANFQLSLEHWYNYELFTWQWWGKFIYLIIPMIIFYKLVDRKRIFEILTYGLMISVISITIDVIGVNFVLWEYPIRFFPVGFFQIHDIVVIPIVSMLVFQYCPDLKSFTIVNFILAVIGAYAKEPLYQWINVYNPINWRHLYSLILFFAMTLICKYIMEMVRNRQRKSAA